LIYPLTSVATTMFHRTPFFLPWLYPALTWRIRSEEKVLYLTFDDGPVPGPTEFVLDELKKQQSQATFFCIGDNVQRHPDIFIRIVSEGHTIGNHTFHHVNGWKTEREDYIENVKMCDEVIQKYQPEGSKMKSSLFRPPYGKITRKQIKALNDYDIIMWDVLTYDFEKRISPQACLKNSVRATRPGSIIVFHDSLKAERNISYALPRFLEHFLNQGYVFRSIPS